MPRRERFGEEREIRLRPAFAHLYPGLLAGVWVPAWSVAEQLVLGDTFGPGLADRACDPKHFDFRGGRGRPSGLRSVHTRATDSGKGGREARP